MPSFEGPKHTPERSCSGATTGWRADDHASERINSETELDGRPMSMEDL